MAIEMTPVEISRRLALAIGYAPRKNFIHLNTGTGLQHQLFAPRCPKK